jgi:plasmid maintenance system antidote protein VapI
MTIPDQIFRDAIRDAVRDTLDDLRLLSVPQAAELLDVSPDTLRRLVGGEFVDVGGKGMKVKLSTIKRIINERTLCLKD